MRPLREAEASAFRDIRFVLTDMDETLTYRGRLSARTYDALDRLQRGGVAVVPVTAAPAGWCDQIARMWPVDGVIGENGGFFFRRAGGHSLDRLFWHGEDGRREVFRTLEAMAARVVARTGAQLAEDQPFRLTSIAFTQPETPEARAALVAALRAEGADVTVNNLWVLGWLGGYDKLAMGRRILGDACGLSWDQALEQVLYVGDSVNDAPTFGAFRHTVGVSTVVQYRDEIPVLPRWITEGPGGDGFVEAADAILAARAG